MNIISNIILRVISFAKPKLPLVIEDATIYSAK